MAFVQRTTKRWFTFSNLTLNMEDVYKKPIINQFLFEVGTGTGTHLQRVYIDSNVFNGIIDNIFVYKLKIIGTRCVHGHFKCVFVLQTLISTHVHTRVCIKHIATQTYIIKYFSCTIFFLFFCFLVIVC